MKWVSITLSDLENAKVAALVDALDTAALAEDQPARAADHIQKVVNRIRSEVAACKTNRVDSDATTIPVELKDLAERMIIWSLKNALEIEPTQQEMRDHTDDLNYLRRIASCEIAVSTPDDPIEPDVQPSGPSVTLIRPKYPHPFGKLGAS